MRKYLLATALLGAAGCSSAPTTETTKSAQVLADPTHIKVEAYLKKTLDDPASYQPAHWGKVEVFRQKDADAIMAPLEDEEFENQIAYAKAENGLMSTLNAVGGSDAEFNKHAKAAKILAQRADSVRKVAEHLRNSTDSTRIGTWVWHAFRAKNKMGALVLDSAHFIVKKSGEVIARKD